MVSTKQFKKIVDGLPTVDQKRQLDPSELDKVAGGGEPYVEVEFSEHTFSEAPPPYWDVPFNLATDHE